MTPEDRETFNTINSKVRNQTYVLDPLLNEFRDKTLRDGFRSHLPQILQSLQRLCNPEQRVPFTILSKMPNAVDYWEPSIQDTSGERFVSICLSLRNLVNTGLSEALYVFSEASLPKTNAQSDERLHVRWVCERESRHYVFQVSDGRLQQPVRTFHELNNALMVIFNPWNTNAELFEVLGIPESEHASWNEFMTIGTEEIRRVCGLFKSPEAQSEEPGVQTEPTTGQDQQHRRRQVLESWHQLSDVEKQEFVTDGTVDNEFLQAMRRLDEWERKPLKPIGNKNVRQFLVAGVGGDCESYSPKSFVLRFWHKTRDTDKVQLSDCGFVDGEFLDAMNELEKWAARNP